MVLASVSLGIHAQQLAFPGAEGYGAYASGGRGGAQWKFSGDKHKSLQVDTERTFHQQYPLVML